MKQSLPVLPPQAITIYQLLLKESPLNAKSIGEKLHIFPHAVYREIKRLNKAGLVSIQDSYPVTFSVNPLTEAIDSYLLAAKSQFIETFFPKELQTNSNGLSKKLQISFIHNRQELLELSNEDIKQAKKEVHHIVSGLEIPAENILEIKNAALRGVDVKFLVQQLTEVNKEMLKNWQKIGINIRYYPSLEARIISIDSHIVYITSYNAEQQEEGVGVRFEYAPIAQIMNGVFHQRWNIGTEIE